ncbi:1,3-beta-glucan synthase protein [Dioscorea alata]|uniref:1,3-beta-glucan synthase protein n=1 Tax=Dioscorea alata TaxID=55571 RepID=A0ACB7V9I4_DIOAL|nr:1,3-beta-glucan synthase protein [Dioscorea alata]
MANKAEEIGDVVILFQDMLEVVTKDIMDEEFPGYGIGFLFLSPRAIKFPRPESDAWTEKLSEPLLNEAQGRSIVDEIKHVITASSTKITERTEWTKKI